MRASGKVPAVIVTAILLCSVFLLGSFTQTNAVRMKWTSYVIHQQNGEADVHFVGTIPNGWKIYSKTMEGKIGPLPTTFEFDPSDAYETTGDITESGKTSNFYDSQYGFEVSCLEGQVHYIQHIKIKDGTESFVIKAVVNYMLNRTGESLSPDDEDFEITVQ
jgi:thiol:disulfide interchange protein DsbD